MDFTQISEWLRTTVPGIILLGIIGSLFAAAIIWFARRFLFRAIFSGLVKFIAGVALHLANPAVENLVKFLVHKDSKKTQVFFLLQLMKFMLAIFLATCAFILFALALSQSEANLAHPSVLVPLIASLLFLWYGLRYVAIAMLWLHFDLEQQVKDAKAKALSKRTKANAS